MSTVSMIAGCTFMPHDVLCAQAASLDQFDRLLFITVTPLCALSLIWAVYTCMPFLVVHVMKKSQPTRVVRIRPSSHSSSFSWDQGCTSHFMCSKVAIV